MGHLTFLPKRLSAVGNKRISQVFASAREPRSRYGSLLLSVPLGFFSVVVVLYSHIVEYVFVYSVERRQAEQEIRSG